MRYKEGERGNRIMSVSIFDILKTKELYIFGGGTRGREIFSILSKRSIIVKAFIDNDKTKQGSMICGIDCISLEMALINGDKNPGVIISPQNKSGIAEQLEKVGIDSIYDSEEIIKSDYYFPVITCEGDYSGAFPFNFYESPFHDVAEIRKNEKQVLNYNKEILDIDFNVERQIELLNQMKQYDIIEWSHEKQEKYRYYYDNCMFSHGSAEALYYMLRILKPRRVIEVGSGFSTALMLDTNNICFNNKIKISSIEPYPERLRSLLREEDNLEIHECGLQDIPVEYFNQLQANDILFIDSSHVAKLGSDINYYLFEIFPRLSAGVYIHIHDIFYPFIYPKNWIWQGRPYNEMYLLQAFLMNNDRYSIQFFGEMIMRECSDLLNDRMQELGGSIWLRKEY